MLRLCDPLRSSVAMSTQLSCRSLSSSKPSFKTGPLISSLPLLIAPFFLRFEDRLLLRSRRLSIRFKKLLARDRVLLLSPLHLERVLASNAKVPCSRGEGMPSEKESSLAPEVPEEHTLATELARVVEAVATLE